MRAGVLLSGPPASGKDTVTVALERLDMAVKLFPRLKAGSGRMKGYRQVPLASLDEMDAAGLIAQRHERYHNHYAIDRPYLERMLVRGEKPIIHVGRLDNLRQLQDFRPDFLSVLFWVSEDIMVDRLRHRADRNISERVVAWREERDDLVQLSEPEIFDIAIDTGVVEIVDTARLILRAMEEDPCPALDPRLVIETMRESAS
jgi:guanylate kinase